MEWWVFALLAPAFWALNNVVYKFLMTKKFRSYFSMLFYLVLVDAIFAVFIFLATPISFQFPYSLFALLDGLRPLVAFWFYSKALMQEEISRVISLFQLIPIFVVILSTIFLNEILGIHNYFGIALIVIGSILISYKKSKGKKSLSSALGFMIAFDFIIAIFTIFEKYLLSYLDYWSLLFWSVIGTFTSVLFLLSFAKAREELATIIPLVGKKGVLVTFLGEGLSFVGTIFGFIAISLVSVSLASALFGLQPFYVFVYMLIVSIFLPQILKEEISKSVIALKISAIALMFIGTWLIV